MSRFQNNLTSGSVTKQLLSFSTPFLLSNLIQALYNVADMLIVSWFSGANSVSGVANGGQITIIVINFIVGLSIGGTVLVGQYFGSNRHGEVKKTIGTLLSVLSIVSIVITIIMIAFSSLFLELINTPAESFSESKQYLNICMAGTVFLFGYNAVSGILRGLGDSKRPLAFVLIACAVNIVLDLVLVGIFDMKAAGAAIATVISQALSLVISIVYLVYNGFIFDFKPKSFIIDKQKAKMIFKLGIPQSIQNVTIGLSFLVMTALVNAYGVNASAALGIVGKFNTFAILPAVAMSSSVASMCAQNFGAKQIDRARKTMYTGIKVLFPVCALFFLIAFFMPEIVLRIFSNEKEVIEQGIKYIDLFCFDYLIVPFTFCINGLLIGAGHTTFIMINGVMGSILLRLPLAFIFSNVLGMGIRGVGFAAPAATFGVLIIAFIYYKSGRWVKNNRLIGEG